MHGGERLRLFKASVLVAGAFMLLVHAASAHSVTPSVVVDSYERAWGLQDVDGALALLADDAVITFQDPRVRSLTRRQQIRDFLEGASLQGAPALTTTRQVDANQVTWSERLEGHVLNTAEVTVQAVVEDGKIQTLVYRSGSLVRGPTGPTTAATPGVGGGGPGRRRAARLWAPIAGQRTLARPGWLQPPRSTDGRPATLERGTQNPLGAPTLP